MRRVSRSVGLVAALCLWPSLAPGAEPAAEAQPAEPEKPRQRYDGAPVNQVVRLRLDYQFRGVGGTENHSYVDENAQTRYVEMSKGGRALGFGMEGFARFGTLGLAVMMPIGGSVQVGDSDTGARFAYRNAAVWNFNIGPGIMSRRGLGIYGGYDYKYHYLDFKDDVTVPGYEVEYIQNYFFARSQGFFVAAYAPLGRSLLVGMDYRQGALRPGFAGERDQPRLGAYNEFSVIFFPHSRDDVADGLHIRVGSMGYDLAAADGSSHRTGGGFIQIGGSFTSEQMTQTLVDTNNALQAPPSDPPPD